MGMHDSPSQSEAQVRQRVESNMQRVSVAFMGELSALFKTAAEAGMSAASYIKYQQSQKAGVVTMSPTQLKNVHKGQEAQQAITKVTNAIQGSGFTPTASVPAPEGTTESQISRPGVR